MATYNDQVSRTDAGALIPEDASREILGTVAEASSVMTLGRRLPDMSRAQRRLPVWQTLPQAYFVSGDTGQKQTTDASWTNVYLNAEELAVIVPIPEAVLDDVDYDIWGEMKPAIASAFGKAFDQAVLYGINAPSSWPVNIEQQCENRAHDVTRGEIGALWEDILSEGGMVSLVEEDGYMGNGFIAALEMRGRLRGLKDTTGQPLFINDLSQAVEAQGGAWTFGGERMLFPRNGAIDPTRSLAFYGDWTQLVWSMRQDLTYKVLTEAVITDGSGTIVFNLAQQDMVALRCVMRLGWALPNPPNLVKPTGNTRFPFSVLEPTAAS
ncbi:MAG: phage major capsid protein [Ilumatobacteraceae bacterium]